MLGDCHAALGQWEDARTVLLAALHHCESTIALLPRTSPSYPALIAQQQVLHLLGDVHTALSEATPPSSSSPSLATSLALTALSYACRAEEEAEALLVEGERDAEEEREVKEAILSAQINVAMAHSRLITLLPPPLNHSTSSPSPSPSPSPTLPASPGADLHPPEYHLREAKRRLRKAYASARSFTLHLYMFLCQWHLMRVEVVGGVKGEAVRHVREGLTVFERCRADAKSGEVEWEEAEWKREERQLLVEGAALVCDVVDEGERGGHEVNGEGEEREDGERKELVAEAFGWIDRVRRQIRGGEAKVDEEERRRVVRLFNTLRQRLVQLEQGGVGQAGAGVTGDGKRGVADTALAVKRRRVLEG